jgi:hypothetical protein
MPTESIHDARCATIAECIATLPLWEGDLIAHPTEDFYPNSSLYDLLQLSLTSFETTDVQQRNTRSEEVYNSTIWSACGSASADSLTTSRHSWTNLVTTDCHQATIDLYPQCNETQDCSHLYRFQVRERGVIDF